MGVAASGSPLAQILLPGGRLWGGSIRVALSTDTAVGLFVLGVYGPVTPVQGP